MLIYSAKKIFYLLSEWNAVSLQESSPKCGLHSAVRTAAFLNNDGKFYAHFYDSSATAVSQKTNDFLSEV